MRFVIRSPPLPNDKIVCIIWYFIFGQFLGSPSESFGSESGMRSRPAAPPTDLDLARPQTAGEEELQLQLALAMSREEAEKEDEKRRSDDVRLALAITQSQDERLLLNLIAYL